MRLPKLMTIAGVAIAALMAAAPMSALAEDLQMWERTGGNATMVDKLVEMWNEKNPDRKINLTYIPHSEMVPKLAQAIASGEVPDLMGLDLIYGPQFESGRSARGHHRLVQGLTRRSRPRARATSRSRPMTAASTACRSMPTSRCCSGTRTCSRRPGSIPRSRPDEPAGHPRHGRQDHRARRRQLTATTSRATAPAATSSPSAR